MMTLNKKQLTVLEATLFLFSSKAVLLALYGWVYTKPMASELLGLIAGCDFVVNCAYKEMQSHA